MTERGSAGVVRFGPFRLDPLNARLWRGDQALRLTPKAFGVLAFLVSRAGRLVSKDDLLTAVWPEVTVSEAALTVCIREIRQVLKDDAREPREPETTSRTGWPCSPIRGSRPGRSRPRPAIWTRRWPW